MDVGQKSDKVNLTGGFGATKGGKWVAEHCWEYGFIIRYQKGWEEITGYLKKTGIAMGTLMVALIRKYGPKVGKAVFMAIKATLKK